MRTLVKVLVIVAALLALGLLLRPTAAAADPVVGVEVHIVSQTMQVTVEGVPLYDWLVSTARPGRRTPEGEYAPASLEQMHYSKRYHHAPMPWTIFFSGNFAIHGTDDIADLGMRASHGCVRLDPTNAHALYYLVEKYGKENTSIIISQ